MNNPAFVHNPDSVLFITLDSCRYDTFRRLMPPNICDVGSLSKAMSPSYFTYGSHAAMFMGFLPSIYKQLRFKNSKYSKLFRLAYAGFSGRESEGFVMDGPSIIAGFSKRGYRCIGSGAAGWFDPNTETGAVLSKDFDSFFYPGEVWELSRQLEWLDKQIIQTAYLAKPIFVFLNIGETHVPYWHEGALWDRNDNPCIPFQKLNRRRDCRLRQRACLSYVDKLLAPLLEAFQQATIVVTADHGDCWGEDGLWEHGISHQRTLEVPLLIRYKGVPM